MTTDEFKAFLDERIKVLGTELEECIMAKKALNRAQAIIDGKARATPARSVPAKPDRKGARDMREQIISVISSAPGPIQSKDIIKKVFGEAPNEKAVKRAHNALWSLGVTGKIQKVGVATYQAVNHG